MRVPNAILAIFESDGCDAKSEQRGTFLAEEQTDNLKYKVATKLIHIEVNYACIQ